MSGTVSWRWKGDVETRNTEDNDKNIKKGDVTEGGLRKDVGKTISYSFGVKVHHREEEML